MCYKQNGMSAERYMPAGEQARRLARIAAEKKKAAKNASDDNIQESDA